MRRGVSLSLLLSLSVLLGLLFGSIPIPVHRIFSDERYGFIVFQIRFPRVAMAGISGAVLAMVGATFQGVLRNPLVDPYLIGVSAGASFGAVLSLSMAEILSPVWLSISPIVAFSFALLSSFLVLLLSRRGSSFPTTEVILSGVAVSMVFNSGLIILGYFLRRSVQGISTWIFGNLSGCVWRDLILPGLGLVIFTLVSIPMSFKLDAMGFGEDFARVSGVETETVKLVVFVFGILSTSLVVSKVGPIGFVGLIIPHLSRIVFGPNHIRVIPASAVLGASFLISADLLSRSLIPPLEIPVGVITSLVGVPVFILLMRRRGSGW